jgi:hypothetical protein
MNNRRVSMSDELVPGAIIYYRLLPSQLPVHPEKEWKGWILSIHIEMPGSPYMSLVECLDDGYDLATEFVLISQIARVEF